MNYSRNVGFFNERINEYSSIRLEENTYVNYAMKILTETESIFSDFGDELKTNKDLVIVTLIIRIFQSFNSIILLNLHGLEADSKSILRVMTEATIQVGAIVNDIDYYNEFLKKSDEQTLIIANNIRNPKHGDFISKDIVDAFNDVDFADLEKLVNTISKQSKSLYKVAQKAQMLDVYIYVYGELSKYVHSNGQIIDEYLEYESGKLVGINNLPRNNEDQYVLLTANMIILKAFDFYNTYFSYDFGELIKELWEENKKMFSSSVNAR